MGSVIPFHLVTIEILSLRPQGASGQRTQWEEASSQADAELGGGGRSRRARRPGGRSQRRQPGHRTLRKPLPG